jgi:hypothetical protein
MIDETPEFYTGTPVEPQDLWFRDEFIAALWELLTRNHVLLTAPRRTGKTSVMEHLRENARHGFQVVSIFVQDLDHPAEFFLTLVDAFHDRHPDLLQRLAKGWTLLQKPLERIAEIGVGGFKIALREAEPDWDRGWKAHGEQFFRLVRAQGERTLFIVDEFPDMLLAMRRRKPELLEEFLAWFRGHRLKPRPPEDSIRWLVGGSVNLSATLDALNCLDLVNDMHSSPLPPLTDKQVKEFVQRMLEGRRVKFAASVPSAVVRHLGRPIPLFLQMATQDLYRIWKQQRRKLTSRDVGQVFDDLIVSPAAREKLQHYHSRISQYYFEPNRSAAYELLAALSGTDEGLERPTLFRHFEQVLQQAGHPAPGYERKRLFQQLLGDLENDFYVAEISGDRFDFVSGVIKTWWRKYYA